jgi:hypothetical protein
MNISALDIYIWQQVERMTGCCIAMSVFAGIILFIYFMANDGKMRKSIAISTFAFIIINILFATFIPSKNTVAMMYIIPAIAKSKVVQEDIPEIYDAAVEALKNNLKEATK